MRATWRECPATRRGFLGALLLALGGLSPASLPATNPFRGLPLVGLLQTSPGRLVATVVMLLGVVLLVDSWLRLRPDPRKRRVARTTLWWWSVPLVAAPPLFSFDAYSYAAQGYVVHEGLDPYSVGPAAVSGPFSVIVDPLWEFTPAPYGPLSLQIQHALVDLSGGHPYLAAVLMRLPALLGVILLAVFLPRLAHRLGYNRESTIWLAVLNPLVVMHLVGGAHNDSLMLGLLVLGLWWASRGSLLGGATAVALASLVKQPAALGLLAVAALVAWQQLGRAPQRRELVPYLAKAGGVFVAVFTGVTLATGLGFGWLGTLGVPGTIRSVLSVPTSLAGLLEQVLMASPLEPLAGYVVPIAQRVSTVVGLVVMAVVAWRFAAPRPVRSLGWMLLVFVVTSPVVHPWYLLWGGVFVAMTEQGPTARRVVVWGTAGLLFYSAIDSAFRNGALALAMTAAAALAWVATGHDRDLIRSNDTIRAEEHRAAAAAAGHRRESR